MPYTFSLPTTSSLSYSSFLSSSTHPSLPLTATTYRSVLRNVLKKHKRLPLQAQTSNLSHVLSTINEYLPYAFAIEAGISGRLVGDEEIVASLDKEIDVEWRACLLDTLSRREVPRVNGKGLDYELCFALETLACIYSLLARMHLLTIHKPGTSTLAQRTTAIASATKDLLQACSLHSYLSARSTEAQPPSIAIDISASTQTALAALALAEATLLAVLKDDPYPAVVAQDRDKNDKEWMIKAPDIPKVRAHLFARLCLAAAEHAGKAHALLIDSSSGRSRGVDKSLLDYIDGLKKTSRAKACRFFGIDADLGGKTGEGIAWLSAGMKELGFKIDESSFKMKGLSKLKRDWTERREDKKVQKGGDWGSDAGRLEEARVIEMLKKKWNKMNDTVK